MVASTRPSRLLSKPPTRPVTTAVTFTWMVVPTYTNTIAATSAGTTNAPLTTFPAASTTSTTAATSTTTSIVTVAPTGMGTPWHVRGAGVLLVHSTLDPCEPLTEAASSSTQIITALLVVAAKFKDEAIWEKTCWNLLLGNLASKCCDDDHQMGRRTSDEPMKKPKKPKRLKELVTDKLLEEGKRIDYDSSSSGWNEMHQSIEVPRSCSSEYICMYAPVMWLQPMCMRQEVLCRGLVHVLEPS